MTQLKPLTVAEAAELVEKIATSRNDKKLAKFAASSRGRARIRALHHLTGGNQRLFIILSDFINKESLDSLVGPFEDLVDEQLTPYYQERLRWLATLQRRIVEFLCTASKPVAVKEIARHLFATSQTISSQLKDLKSIGYVESRKRGRESLYELAEPLMRLSYQVKEAKGRAPLRLLVDFLRVWYDHEELRSRIDLLDPLASVTKEYFAAALELHDTEGNLRLHFFREDADGLDLQKCTEEQVGLLRDLMEESNDPQDAMNYGLATSGRRLHESAIAAFSRVIEDSSSLPEMISNARILRGCSYGCVELLEKSVEDFTAAAKVGGKAAFNAIRYRAKAYEDMGESHKSIEDLSHLINLPECPSKTRIESMLQRGEIYNSLNKMNEALSDLTEVVEYPESPEDWKSRALLNRSNVFLHLNNVEAFASDIESIISLPNAPRQHVAIALMLRGTLASSRQEQELAIGDFRAAAEEPAVTGNARALILHQLANSLMATGQWEDGFATLDSGLADIGDKEEFRLAPSPLFSATIFVSGNSSKVWQPRIARLVKIYEKHKFLTMMGSDLVESIPHFKNANLSAAGFAQWHSVWAIQADAHSELQLP